MTETTPRSTAAVPLLRTYQVGAVLAALAVLFQFITAGQLFPDGGPEGAHAAGAVVLHVVSGVAALSAVLLWRKGDLSGSTAGLAVAVFAFTFVQAALGGRSSLALHVPGAMVLTAGVVWQVATALRVRRA